MCVCVRVQVRVPFDSLAELVAQREVPWTMAHGSIVQSFFEVNTLHLSLSLSHTVTIPIPLTLELVIYFYNSHIPPPLPFPLI